MINHLPLHPHEEDENLITESILTDAGYVIKTDLDFYQSKEDYLLGLGLIRAKHDIAELELKCYPPIEFETEELYKHWRSLQTNYRLNVTHHLTWCQKMLDTTKTRFKVYEFKNKGEMIDSWKHYLSI